MTSSHSRHSLVSMSRRTQLFALVAAFAPALLFAQSSATIQLLILGSGSITFPNGGKCATTCSMQVPRGASITLEATPKSGWVTSGWGGCRATISDMNHCTTTTRVDGDLVMTVEFKDLSAPVYTQVVIDKSGNGSLKSSPPGIDCNATCYQAHAKFLTGSTVTIEATPGSDGVRPMFGGCIPATNTATSCSVTMNSGGLQLRVYFGHIVSVDKSGIGKGTLTSSPPGIDCGTRCIGRFSDGTTVTFKATAAAGSGVGDWSGCMPLAEDKATCTVKVTSGLHLSASFTGPQYPLTANIVGSGSVMSARGEVCRNKSSCTMQYENTLTATLTASPANPWTFGSWSGCPAVTGMKCTVPMTGPHVVTATFIAPPSPSWPLTIEWVNSGSGTGSGTVTSVPAGINCGATCTASWKEGTTVTLTAAPAAGSVLRAWFIGGCQMGAELVCNVTLTQARTVPVQFIKK
jgi:hypothetical protein